MADEDGRVDRIYDELRTLARSYMNRERAGHTLQATALVHEAFLKVGEKSGHWNDTSHFRAVAARAMRQVLIDHARGLNTAKRGGESHDRAPLEEVIDSLGIEADRADSLAVAEAIERLSKQSSRMASIVEMRFFGGLTNPEIARQLGVSLSTVEDDWRMARPWLRRELAGGQEADADEDAAD